MSNTNNVRLSPLAISKVGYAVIPVTYDNETVWCIRTRQNINPNILRQFAPQMIVEDPQSVIPSGQNDLPYAHMVQLGTDGAKNVASLSDKSRFRTVSFARDTFFGITTDGTLVSASQITEHVRRGKPNVEFTTIDMAGLPDDAEVTALLAITTKTGIRMLAGVTTTKTNYWLFEGAIDHKDTRTLEMKPIEGRFSQVVGLRTSFDSRAVLLTTSDGTVWGAMNDHGKPYDFRKLYGFHMIADTR